MVFSNHFVELMRHNTFQIKKDLTQEQLSEILDINQNYIACIECGRQNMSLGKILELANALQVDIETLLKFND